MTVLRVVDRRVGDRRRVAVSWDDGTTLTHETEISLPVDDVESEKVRWYLEDYAEIPAEPAPTIAQDAEALMATTGRGLFERVFAGRGAAKVWTKAEDDLAGVRVEIDTDPSDVPGVPWELMRNPDSNQAVALGAAQFVRTHHQTTRAVALPEPTAEPLRVLLVICRPGGADDVPFRSVASRLVRSGVDRLAGLSLDVLRPPTFAQLAKVLRAAAEAGRPYHIVHFDGHGAFLDACEFDDTVAVSALTFGAGIRDGRHGFLVFEEPSARSKQRLVDGPTLGELLVDTRVPVLVLNACRSAYAEAPPAPDPAAGVHERIRAYGSLAAEVADQGVPGVVAMRYTVYVDTAARFVEVLYEWLAAGRSLGAAVSAARKALADDPNRQIGATPVALQDWVVPTVYEPVELVLRTPTSGAPPVPQRSVDVPDAPDIGFFGRDDALLALDRAFDTDKIVLLHALAGAGKSTTAAEFARWYRATGGVDGPVLWTSFEHYMPLERVLDAAGAMFAPLLEANGVQWAAVSESAQRRALVLHVLAAVPVLWVWDNVEPVAGFPSGTPSAWTAHEQAELRGFLRELQQKTRTKVLLTSRRDEYPWLGDLPRRARLAPMPMRESLQLTHALVRRLSDVRYDAIDWHGLLRFTGGNPLTIMVLVRQAVLQEKVTTTAQVDALVARVEAGAPLEPARNAELGRTASLAASLAYGFDHAFTEAEQAQLALLHLFREVVHAADLCLMSEPVIALTGPVAALAGSDHSSVVALLDRAAELGLLTEHGGGRYGIHPALPWFFRDLFGRLTPDPTAAEHAYARAYAALGRQFWWHINQGGADQVLPALRASEANLHHALQISRRHRLDDGAVTPALGCAQGLSQLYDLTGRTTEWARLVDEFTGDYVDPATGRPRPGREDDYSLVLEYRVAIARTRRDWPTAIRLQTIRTVWDRDRAAPYLDRPVECIDGIGHNRLRALATSELLLGQLLLDQEDPGCLPHLRAAYDLTERHGDQHGQAAAASSLGNAHIFVPALRDLDQAHHWLRRDLDLTPEHDRIGRASTYLSLATLAYERVRDVPPGGPLTAQQVAHLREAEAGYYHALNLLPDDHHGYRATIHNQLGNVRKSFRDVPGALGHYQQSIRHAAARGDAYGAGRTRANIAILLGDNNRLEDALHYAHAALDTLRPLGPGAGSATDQVEFVVREMERLIADS